MTTMDHSGRASHSHTADSQAMKSWRDTAMEPLATTHEVCKRENPYPHPCSSMAKDAIGHGLGVRARKT